FEVTRGGRSPSTSRREPSIYSRSTITGSMFLAASNTKTFFGFERRYDFCFSFNAAPNSPIKAAQEDGCDRYNKPG
ncbi:hypothetical protein, partial [Bradyrhizobium liaoningense]|uniref:hypothetical protein n=1 Tax=Bradyrhizobium liaoningense TaxID=43992 RepID=UPI001AEBD811